MSVYGVVMDYAVGFPAGPMSFGLPEALLPYIAMGVLIFIALCFVRTQPGPTVIVISFFEWIFFFMGPNGGWWVRLADLATLVGVMSAFTFFAVIYNIAKRSKTYGV